jgi:hypothetical protein
MNRRAMRSLAPLIAAAFLSAGCSTSSTGPEPTDQTEYHPRTSPQNVIGNVGRAYGNMDAEAYLDCLAEDFIFFLNPGDLTEFPALPEYWDKAEETAIHENMFGEGTDVQRITLVFTHVSAVYDPGPTGDPLDDLWTYVEDADLRVELPPNLTLHAEAPAEFLFRVDPDEVGPNGEILWEIWKQWDIEEEGRGGRSEGRESTSWGTVKAMFR